MNAQQIESFEELYKEFLPKIFKYFYFRLQDEMMAEDRAAETFFRSFRQWPPRKLDRPTVVAWLFRIALNLQTDHYRKQGRDRRTLAFSLDDQQSDSADLLFDKHGEYPGDDEHFQQYALFVACASLPASDQRLLGLYVSGLTHQEIAKIFGVSDEKVRRDYLSAIRRLQKQTEAAY